MSLLCLKYYELLKQYSINYKSILSQIETDSANLRSCASQNSFINNSTDLTKKIYLNYYNFIDHNNLIYNQNKIINLTTQSRDQILEQINKSNLIPLINIISKFKDTYTDLVNEYTLQKYIISNINTIYDKNLFIFNYRFDDYITNFSSLLKNDIINIDHNLLINLNKHSFFHYYFLKSYLNYYFDTYNSLKRDIDVISDNSNNYINYNLSGVYSNQIDNISEEIIRLLLIHQYNINNSSSGTINRFKSSGIIIDKIINFVNIFDTFVGARAKELTQNYYRNVVDLLNHYMSFTLTTKMFNINSVFNFIGLNSTIYRLYEVSDLSYLDAQIQRQTNFMTTLSDFETQIIDSLQNVLNTTYSLRDYFNILYLYRNVLHKFINIIDHVISIYVIDNINFSDIYYFNTFSQMQILFNYWRDNIYIEDFNKEITKYYTKDNQKQIFLVNKHLFKLAFFIEYKRFVDEFIMSEEFNRYMIDLQKTFYREGRSIGIFEQNTDWCGSESVMIVYFKSLLINLSQNSNFFDHNISKTLLSTFIDNSTITCIENDNFFLQTMNEFIESYSYAMFEFFKKFLISCNGAIFSNAVHKLVASH